MDHLQTRTLSVILDEKIHSENEKIFWISRLERAPARTCDDIIALFGMIAPEAMRQLHALQERKEYALAIHDPQAWQNIIDQECDFLNRYI